MTVIVAVTDGERVCMACDSQSSNNNCRATLARPKIVRIGPLLVGAEGTMAVGDFLRYRYVIGAWGKEVELAAWCGTTLADDLRNHLRERDLMEKRGDRTEMPGQLLIAKGGEFLILDTGGSVVQVASPFWAIGSGGPEARGAMWAAWPASEVMHLATNQLHPREETVARAGVEAAIALDYGCGPPVHVEWTE